VIINRFEQRMFSSGLRRNDIEQVLGDSFAACIPNNYSLVREAIDRGIPLDEVKPGNNITAELRKLILPQPVAKSAAGQATGTGKKLKLSWAR
jgi:pilus assembly protein CpaE